MLTREARQRLTVVLVGARNPQNIGAAARAMQDFGFGDLRVVNEYTSSFDTARSEATSAIGAQEIMTRARRFDALPDAIADCHVVAGTTAIGDRSLQRPVLALCEAAPRLLTALAFPEQMPTETPPQSAPAEQPGDGPHRVALLFGSEKSGLTKEQLSYCSMLVTIPLLAPEGRHLSMNLGQSVAVCLYELTRDGFEGARSLPTTSQMLASTAHRERLLGMVLEAMQRSEYTRRFPANARTEVVRQLINRWDATSNEITTWMGFVQTILRHLPVAPLGSRPE